MNNIEELKSAYRDVELTARNMRGKPEEYRVVTGFCPVNVVEMQAQKIQALIAQLEEAQKESAIRLEAIEQMRKTVAHNVERAQTAEAALSAANERIDELELQQIKQNGANSVLIAALDAANEKLSKPVSIWKLNNFREAPAGGIEWAKGYVVANNRAVKAISDAGFTVDE
ncbi:hypothetical protein ACNVFB_004558 [Yersinia enterocolitica]|nr:hypothetical protein [Yersinia enterocolitica]HEN3465202.1 hypothetical protein [Yersinia enterocolitica]